MKRDDNGVASGPGRGKRAFWVQRYRSSGLGLKKFAERHGLSAGQLHYWVYASRTPRSAQAGVPIFQEVRLPSAVVTPTSWTAEVGLPNGTTVRLARETDVAWAMALIDSLRRPCSP